MDEHSTPRRRRVGRPPVEPSSRPAASVYTHITLPNALYDKAYADARRHRMTLPQWIRHTLKEAATGGGQ